MSELSDFDMFHIEQNDKSPTNIEIDNLSLQAYRIFIELDNILKELGIKIGVGIIDTLLNGYHIEKEKIKAKDWADYVLRLTVEIKPIIEEFKGISAEINQIQKQIEENEVLTETFEMLSNISVDLETIRNLKRFYGLFSIVSSKDIKEIGKSIPNDIVVPLSLTPNKSAILIATAALETERINKVLRSYEIRMFEIPDKLPQNPSEAIKVIRKDLDIQKRRLLELNKIVDNMLKKSQSKILSSREGAEVAYNVLISIKKTGDLKRFAIINGYFPTTYLKEFEKRFGKWIFFTKDVKSHEKIDNVLKSNEELDRLKLSNSNENQDDIIATEHKEKKIEYSESSTPTLIKNIPFIRAFENITLNQGPPKHGEIDPTPIITVTFPIFYGLMFGDFGHGLILTLFGLLLYIRGYDSLKQWGIMLTVAGISAATVGLVIGEVFGFEIGSIFPGFQHPLLELLERSNGETSFSTTGVSTILTIAILIGVAHLMIGFIIDVYNGIMEKEYVEVLISKLPTLIMYIAGIIFTLAFIGVGYRLAGLLSEQKPTPLIGIPISLSLTISVPLMLITSLIIMFGKPVAIIMKKEPKESLAMATVMGLVEVLIRIVEFLANTVSYSRLGVLLLVHASLLLVLNRAISLPLFISIPMLIVFNVLIIALEGLIVYIQDLRLHLYEWFTKFYEGTGISFKKIKPTTTYIDIEWETTD